MLEKCSQLSCWGHHNLIFCLKVIARINKMTLNARINPAKNQKFNLFFS